MSFKRTVSAFPEIREKLLIEKSASGKNKRLIPEQFSLVLPVDISDFVSDNEPALPDISEIETVRHYTRLSRLNFGVDHGMYPLGSCTMKYNPRICEEIAARLADSHPADGVDFPNILKGLASLERYLIEICGMDACCLWPAAGAHGELTGMLVIRKAVDANGIKRDKVLIPDTAHGTNPASCSIAGFETVNIPSGPGGWLEAETVKKYLDASVAALMMTNPNTLGIFEREIKEIADLLHANGSYLYMDGANMNALMGITRPGDMGVDCMHVNLHKTFATPHGGGGPGSGPVLVNAALEKFLPVPRLANYGKGFELDWDYPDSIGMVHSTNGNLGVLFKALVYIMSIGAHGIIEASKTATLNANYIKKGLDGIFDLPYKTPTLHEFVLSDKIQKENHVTTMDMAKALMDSGFHPPTVYFPLVVPGTIMIEPTETEPLEELDRFIDAMKEIAAQALKAPETFHDKPLKTPVSRIDEVWAARNLILTWDMIESKKA